MPGPQHPPFEYAPLEAANQEIRLVRILPGSDEIIRCTIETFPIEDAPEFTALSYRWGDPSRSIAILNNGQELRITRSLEEFLLEVLSRQRYPKKHDAWCYWWLWIDAICINQDDVLERGAQVTIMKDIFERSTWLVIWLGSTPEGGSDAITFLNDIADLEDRYPDTLHGRTTSSGLYRFEFGKFGETFLDASHKTIQAASAIFNNQYWDRAWVVQEASTPKEPGRTFVYYGDLAIHWNVLIKSYLAFGRADWRYRVPKLEEICDLRCYTLTTILFFQEARRSRTETFSLYWTLVLTRTAEATDPRDFVYGILGLIAQDHDLKPDYTVGVTDLYSKLARNIISHSRSLDCLGSAGIVEGPVGIREHPIASSWVPNWTIGYNKIPVPFRQQRVPRGEQTRQEDLYSASGGVFPEVRYPTDSLRLEVQGIYYDTTTAISALRPWAERESATIWADWVRVADPSDAQYVEGISRRKAFEKVLTADIKAVKDDRIAERGGAIKGYDDVGVNVFKLGDNIVNLVTELRLLFATSKGYLGLGPQQCKVGDTIVILFGSQMPVILRGQGEHWSFIGQAYVHGIMDGEALVGVDMESAAQTFSII